MENQKVDSLFIQQLINIYLEKIKKIIMFP